MAKDSVQPPLFTRAETRLERIAVVDDTGSHTYRELLEASSRVAGALLEDRADLEEGRVAFFVAPGFHHVAIQWGIWRAGGIAVPLALSHPPAELEYVMRDAEAEALIADAAGEAALAPISAATGARLLTVRNALGGAPKPLPALAPERRAMMVYTSGTTGKPKGVVSTHANLEAQITALIDAWEWNPDDRVLLVLPLHHVHGIVNVVGCALWAGACCETLPKFDAAETWRRIASARLSLFMAVPTIYARLIATWEAAGPADRAAMSAGCRTMRLMVSGSAALPVRTLERWREISGHTLLERYGMTELGMALSNPLHGERRPGFVGTPLPRVEVRLVGDDGAPVTGAAGEIEVRGPNVFLEYWRRPEATRDAFHEGWFRTGDTAIVEQGSYRILGRSSVDIIKTGGFKVSALEIEEELRTHPAVRECAVVGVPDEEWGERVSVAVELEPGASLSLPALQAWSKDRLAPYKVPRALCCVASLPRNAMGKVLKPEVAKLF